MGYAAPGSGCSSAPHLHPRVMKPYPPHYQTPRIFTSSLTAVADRVGPCTLGQIRGDMESLRAAYGLRTHGEVLALLIRSAAIDLQEEVKP